MITIRRPPYCSHTRVVSIVIAWSRSSCAASTANDHSVASKPRRRLEATISSAFPSGKLPVSYIRRPINVDFPWST